MRFGTLVCLVLTATTSATALNVDWDLESETTLNSDYRELHFTLAPDFQVQNPETLVNETSNLETSIAALLNNVTSYMSNFNNVTNPGITSLILQNAALKQQFNLFQNYTQQIENLKNVLANLTVKVDSFEDTLQCYQRSQCVVSTTLPPPLKFMCDNPAVPLSYNVTDGSPAFNITLPRLNFDGSCPFIVNYNGTSVGWYDLTVYSLNLYNSDSAVVVENYNVEQNTTLNATVNATSLTAKDSTIYIIVKGIVSLNIQVKPINPCSTVNCQNGTCLVNHNQPICSCLPCFQTDSQGICSQQTANPCNVYGRLCDTGGICAVDDKCNYYCLCNNGQQCETCFGGGTGCKTSKKVQRRSRLLGWW